MNEKGFSPSTPVAEPRQPSNSSQSPRSLDGHPAGHIDSGTIPLSSAMFGSLLPRVSNLELGFIYNVGPDLRSGRFTADYVLPINLGGNSTLFGEAHAEFQEFWQSPRVSTSGGSVANNRTDLSFGGGYRRILAESMLVGVNGFYDTSRIVDQWYSSGGAGFEMVSSAWGNSALDINLNYYGNIFTSDGLVNAFRNEGGSWDGEVGYSTSLLDDAFDLRLKLNGYQFDVGETVYGWRSGADLTTRDGRFTLRYEYGYDRLNNSYNAFGAFVNMGFQFENLFRGEIPFTQPEPVFASPRNIRRMLTGKVRRNWYQPTAVVLTRACNACSGSGSCVRFLSPVAMPMIVAGRYRSGDVPFPPISYTTLDPTRFFRIEFDYAFVGTPPATVLWSVVVRNGTRLNSLTVGQSTSQSHLVFILNGPGAPAVGQSAFTSTATDPSDILIVASGADGTTALTVTNVCITPNQ
ncbi:MAG: hypothetical protein AB1473_14585 [Thermodesulfobacteriota bacterium]